MKACRVCAERQGVNGADSRPRLEVSEQPLERLLVGVVLLPAGEVPDVTRVLNTILSGCSEMHTNEMV